MRVTIENVLNHTAPFGRRIRLMDSRALLELPDEEAVLLAQQGNKEVLEHMLIRYRNFVYSRSKKYYLSGWEKEDVVQEGMIGLYNAVMTYKPGKSSFKVFAGLCVTRRMMTAVKNSTRQKHIPLNNYLSLYSEAFESEDASEKLIDCLSDASRHNPEEILINRESLSGFEYKINSLLSKLELRVLMYHLEGMSYNEIAERVGRDIKSVDNAVQRIRKKLEAISELD